MISNGHKPGGNSTQVGQVQLKSGARVSPTPPTSGTCRGISMSQDRNAAAQVNISGRRGINSSGVAHAAKAFVNAAGGSTAVPGPAFLAGPLATGGGGMVYPVPAPPVPTPGAGPKAGLAESDMVELCGAFVIRPRPPTCLGP
jgi:hypothetical protein